ncbi:unnamed protein product [Lampetra fluviatilis]
MGHFVELIICGEAAAGREAGSSSRCALGTELRRPPGGALPVAPFTVRPEGFSRDGGLRGATLAPSCHQRIPPGATVL